MNSTPFLSIILPIYNVEKYLVRCIDKLLAEKYKDYEIILVNDGSTDNSEKICTEYASKYLNITTINKINGGLSSARNAGFDVAKGKYIFWLDSDDYIVEGALGIIATELKKYSPDILKFNYIMQPTNKEVFSIVTPGLYDKNEICTNLVQNALDQTAKFIMSAWSHIYKADFLRLNNLKFVSEREIGSEDYLFNFQALLKANSLYVIKDVLYNYDYREGSLTNRYRPNLIEQYRNLYLLMKESSNGNVNKLQCNIEDFYIRNAYYILILNETRVSPVHRKRDGFINIKNLVNQKELIDALGNISIKGKSKKYKLIYTLMKYKITIGLILLLKITGKK